MILLILETHGALYFRSGVDEAAQRIARQRVVIATGIHVLEGSSLMVAALGIRSFKQEAFDLVSGIKCVAFVGINLSGELFQNAADVGTIRFATFIDYLAEYEHLAWPKEVGGRPIERTPIQAQTQVALSLRREAADRGTIERKIVPALEQEFLVIVEHVQASFKIAEEHRHCFDSLLVRQVLEPLLLNLIGGNPIRALFLGFQVKLLQFLVGEGEKIA